MYASDYGFATSPSEWTNNLHQLFPTNWMYMGMNDWTILRNSEEPKGVFFSTQIGNLQTSHVSDELAVRPVFFLTPSVTYVSGSGTQTDPIRIN